MMVEGRIGMEGGGQKPCLDFLLSSDASACSTMAFPPLGNSDVAVSVPLTLRQ